MSESLDESLEIIAKHLSDMQRPVLRVLQRGIAEPEVRRKLSSAGLVAPVGFAMLYGWHNGTLDYPGAKLDDIHIVPGFYFPELDEALTNYATFKSDPRWREGWLPILANGGGDFYAVDCSDNVATQGHIHNFMLDEMEHPLEYLSISAMFAAFAAAYDRKIYFLHPSGYLDANDEAYVEMARTMNLTAPGWALY
jgi:hypothetical protein